MASVQKFVSATEFASAARDKQTDGLGIIYPAVAKVTPGPGRRQLRFTISTGDIDRAGDRIDPSGWDVSAYLKNPVVLWQHHANIPPIAKTLMLPLLPGAIEAVCEFAPADVHPLAETVFQLAANGFISAASVGFAPTEWKFSEDPGRRMGIDFLRCELFEWSIVSVPCNPAALIGPSADAVADGEEGKAELAELTGRLAKHLGLVVSRPTESKAVEAATPEQIAAALATRRASLAALRHFGD